MRHGETDANHKLIVQGRMDNPLNEYGRLQAKRTAEYLIKNHERFDLVVSSPLKRAYETAKIMVDHFDFPKQVLINSQLTERNFGDYDGKQIDDTYARLVVSDTIPNMEKNADLENRVLTALQTLCESHPEKKILVVAHSHVIKAILVKLLPDFTYTSYLFNCSLNYLSFDEGKFQVIAHNINPFD
jgi:broad specificity phosphatase PhoE